MGAIGRLFSFVAALLACGVALVLPYRVRGFFAGLVASLARPGRLTEGRFVRFQLAFWNKVILGTVFYGGMPLSRILLSMRSRSVLGPPKEAPSFWEPRESADALAKGTEDPF